LCIAQTRTLEDLPPVLFDEAGRVAAEWSDILVKPSPSRTLSVYRHIPVRV
jgi:hypothetical protein